MTRLGVPREHAEASVNHLSARSALERTYDTYTCGPKIIADHGKWQAHVAALLNQDTPGSEADQN